jgi:hypothetical protein
MVVASGLVSCRSGRSPAQRPTRRVLLQIKRGEDAVVAAGRLYVRRLDFDMRVCPPLHAKGERLQLLRHKK